MWLLEVLIPTEASASTEDARTRTFRITPGSTKTIGRGPTVDFIVDSPLVSRRHCQLSSVSQLHLEIVDLNSTNGTFVNDERVSKQELKVSDRLKIGRLKLTVKRE